MARHDVASNILRALDRGGERARAGGTWDGGVGGVGVKGSSGYNDNVPEWARDDVSAVAPGVNGGAFISTAGRRALCQVSPRVPSTFNPAPFTYTHNPVPFTHHNNDGVYIETITSPDNKLIFSRCTQWNACTLTTSLSLTIKSILTMWPWPRGTPSRAHLSETEDETEEARVVAVTTPPAASAAASDHRLPYPEPRTRVQKLFDGLPFLGWVVLVEPEDLFPVTVCFDDGERETYNLVNYHADIVDAELLGPVPRQGLSGECITIVTRGCATPSTPPPSKLRSTLRLRPEDNIVCAALHAD